MACLQRFCQLNIRGCLSKVKTFYSTQIYQNNNNVKPLIFYNKAVTNTWIWQKNNEITSPITTISPIIEFPRSILWIPPKNDPNISPKFEIVEPLLEINKIEKQAVKLIVIRRHKMRRHKLRKLRKRMKFEWAKRRQRREMRKEKLFQGQLLAKIKEAEKFSAEEFINEKIRQATEVPVPKLWHGKRLPENLIREKLGLPPK